MDCIPKYWDLPSGRIMVVADLHGNLKDFQQVLHIFQKRKAKGKADYLVLLGDLIHAPKGQPDHSVEIIDELAARGCNQEDSRIFALLGNHEMVHIYHLELWKGVESYTPPFEIKIEGKRKKYADFFAAMPLALRTQGGVLLQHAGASLPFAPIPKRTWCPHLEKLKSWDHQRLLEKMAAKEGIDQAGLLQERFLPQVGSHFKRFKTANFLWEFLSTKNEKQFRERYPKMLSTFLGYFSESDKEPLTCLVTGHIQEPTGAKVVAKKQLRLCSSKGAANDSYKTYLMVNGDKIYEDAHALFKKVRPLYE